MTTVGLWQRNFLQGNNLTDLFLTLLMPKGNSLPVATTMTSLPVTDDESVLDFADAADGFGDGVGRHHGIHVLVAVAEAPIWRQGRIRFSCVYTFVWKGVRTCLRASVCQYICACMRAGVCVCVRVRVCMCADSKATESSR